jgi:DNA-binding transcriptional regulator GbsR (MarR family)
MQNNNALSNAGTSKVFLSIINGVSNPKAIADFLQIQPPPVIEQLRRLRKIGIVTLGEKTGREQNYVIVWPKFLSLFITEAIHKRGDKKAITFKSHSLINQINLLQDNRFFKEFIIEYFKNISDGQPSGWYTITEAIENFEIALTQCKTFKRNKKFEDKEKQSFFDMMQTWYKKTLDADTWLDLCFHDALHKLLEE